MKWSLVRYGVLPPTLFVWELPYFYCSTYGYTCITTREFAQHFNVNYDEFKKRYYTSKLGGLLTGFLLAWIADSYCGRKPLVLMFHALELIFYLFLFSASTWSVNYYLFNEMSATIASYSLVLLYCNEGTRSALILQQIVRYSKQRQGRFVLYWIMVRQLAVVIYNVVMHFNKVSDYFIHNSVVFIISVVYVLIYFFAQAYMAPVRIHYRIVEKCLRCLYEAFLVWSRTWGHNKKQHWIDNAESMCDSRVIYYTKVTYELVTALLPLICYGTTLEIIRNVINSHCENLMSGEDHVLFLKMLGPLDILTLLMFVSNEVILIPITNKLRIMRTPLQRIGTGYFLIGCSLVASSFIDFNVSKEKGFLPAFGYGRLNFCNMMDCNVTVTMLSYHNKTIVVGPCKWEQFQKMKEQTAGLLFEANNCQSQYHKSIEVTVKETQSLTYFLTKKGVILHDQQYQLSPKDANANLINASLYIYNTPKVFSGYLKVVNVRTMIFNSINIPKVPKKIVLSLIPRDDYNFSFIRDLSVPNYITSSTSFQSGSVYVLWLCESVTGRVKANVVTLVSRANLSYLYIFIPLTLCAIGDSMAKKALWLFVHEESAEPLRSVTFALLVFICRGNVSIFFVGGDNWHTDSYTYSILKLAFIHLVCVIFFVHFAMVFVHVPYEWGPQIPAISIPKTVPSETEVKPADDDSTPPMANNQPKEELKQNI